MDQNYPIHYRLLHDWSRLVVDADRDFMERAFRTEHSGFC